MSWFNKYFKQNSNNISQLHQSKFCKLTCLFFSLFFFLSYEPAKVVLLNERLKLRAFETQSHNKHLAIWKRNLTETEKLLFKKLDLRMLEFLFKKGCYDYLANLFNETLSIYVRFVLEYTHTMLSVMNLMWTIKKVLHKYVNNFYVNVVGA